jgi:hypothetical protein
MVLLGVSCFAIFVVAAGKVEKRLTHSTTSPAIILFLTTAYFGYWYSLARSGVVYTMRVRKKLINGGG